MQYGIIFSIRLSISTFLFYLIFLTCPSVSLADATAEPPSMPAAQGNGPANCSSSSRELERSYREAWRLVKENTLYPERLINWQAWQHKFDGRLFNQRDLENAVCQMLARVGDQYTYFRNAKETRTRIACDEEQGVVQAQMLNGTHAYVSVSTFGSRHVAEEFQRALHDLRSAEAYIIDLRGNKGGYIDQALLCFSSMVDHGRFVSIQGRQEGEEYFEEILVQNDSLVRLINGTEIREPRAPNLTGHKPVIVLINDGTRSASEMLAGALRDVRKARLVGSKTFGKGVVQGTWNLEPECSIKIAMARFKLPGGTSINGLGITPDVAAEFEGERELSEITLSACEVH